MIRDALRELHKISGHIAALSDAGTAEKLTLVDSADKPSALRTMTAVHRRSRLIRFSFSENQLTLAYGKSAVKVAAEGSWSNQATASASVLRRIVKLQKRDPLPEDLLLTGSATHLCFSHSSIECSWTPATG